MKLIVLFLFGVIGSSFGGNAETLKAVIDKAASGLENIFDAREKVLLTLKDKSVENVEDMGRQYLENLASIKSQTSNRQVIAKVSDQLVISFAKNVQKIKDNVKTNYDSLQKQLEENFAKNLINFQNSMNQLAARVPSIKPYVDATIERLDSKAEGIFSDGGRKLNQLNAAVDGAFEESVVILRA